MGYPLERKPRKDSQYETFTLSIPAANNAVSGLKPTEGKLSVKNYDNAAPGLVAIGFIGQSFEDIAEGYMLTSRQWPTSQVADTLQDLRIGIDPQWFEHASKEVAETTITCLERLTDSLEQSGATPNLLEMDYLPKGFEKPLWDTHAVLFGRGEAEGKASYIDKGIPAEIELALIMGLSLDQSTIEKAHENKKRLAHHFQNNVFSKVDIIAMPTLLTTAPKASRPWFESFDNGELNLPKTYLMTAHTGLANLTGGPRITVHCGFDEDNLPIGLQLMGDDNSEYLLMMLGALVEKSIYKRDKDHPAWKKRPYFDPMRNAWSVNQEPKIKSKL